jgi:hypothetical protein
MLWRPSATFVSLTRRYVWNGLVRERKGLPASEADPFRESKVADKFAVFAFTAGAAPNEIRTVFKNTPIISKPVVEEELIDLLP